MRALSLCRLALVACALGVGCTAEPADLPPPPHAADSRPGFVYASADRPLAFPGDYGPHPEYQTEWWYYTGNLRTADQRRFAYQLTFFRRSLVAPAERVERTAELASADIYMGHFALIDVAAAEHRLFERFSRGGGALAGARSRPHAVWLDDWKVSADGAARVLSAADDDVALQLTLLPTLGPILHGEGGYSRKGADPRQASHYYTFPRLDTRGTVEIGGSSHAVSGSSWMDHEFTSSGLGDEQIGWDWFSLQLSDGSALMLFHLRTRDGGIDAYSSGTWIGADGSQRHLKRDDFAIAVDGHWTSPHTGARYPAVWRIEIPSVGLTLDARPFVADQEVVASFVYWEGAVEVTGSSAGGPVEGVGFVELTGYASSMKGAF